MHTVLILSLLLDSEGGHDPQLRPAHLQVLQQVVCQADDGNAGQLAHHLWQPVGVEGEVGVGVEATQVVRDRGELVMVQHQLGQL